MRSEKMSDAAGASLRFWAVCRRETSQLRTSLSALAFLIAWSTSAFVAQCDTPVAAVGRERISEAAKDLEVGSLTTRYDASIRLLQGLTQGKLTPTDLQPSPSDALVDMFLDPTLDVGTANIAAVAWGRLKAPIPRRMFDVLGGHGEHKTVALVALALRTAGNPAAANPLIDALGSVTEREDDRFEPLEQALGALDRAAAQAMVARLPLASSIQKQAIAEGVGFQFFGGDPPPDAAITAALQRLLKPTEDRTVRRLAAEAMGRDRASDPVTLDALIDALRSDPDSSVRSAAGGALAALGCPDLRTQSALVQALLASDDADESNIREALQACKVKPLQTLLDLLLSTSAPTLRARLIRALTDIGPAAAAAIPQFMPDFSGTDEQLRAATDGLPNLGPAALVAVPSLVERLSREDDQDRRRQVIAALADVAHYAAAKLPLELANQEAILRRSFQRSINLVDSLAEREEQPDQFRQRYLSPLRQASYQLEDAPSSIRGRLVRSDSRRGDCFTGYVVRQLAAAAEDPRPPRTQVDVPCWKERLPRGDTADLGGLSGHGPADAS